MSKVYIKRADLEPVFQQYISYKTSVEDVIYKYEKCKNSKKTKMYSLHKYYNAEELLRSIELYEPIRKEGKETKKRLIEKINKLKAQNVYKTYRP
ncbi:MAG: hypothetical protein LBD17_02730 [Endomicrobium sp.]|jgi:hypothetical protein|nr:hypothetical protein [Endomicrobium sp.]